MATLETTASSTTPPSPEAIKTPSVVDTLLKEPNTPEPPVRSAVEQPSHLTERPEGRVLSILFDDPEDGDKATPSTPEDPLVVEDRKSSFSSIRELFTSIEAGSIQDWLAGKAPHAAMRYVENAQAMIDNTRDRITRQIQDKKNGILHPEMAKLDAIEEQLLIIDLQLRQAQLELRQAIAVRNRNQRRTTELSGQINEQLDALQSYASSFPPELLNGKDFSAFPAILDRLEQETKDKLSNLAGKVIDRFTPHRALGQLSANQIILVAQQLKTDVLIWQELKKGDSSSQATIEDCQNIINTVEPQQQDLLQQKGALLSRS